MSEALRLADKLELEWHNNALNYDTAIDSSIELRRLAPMEAELAALRASLVEPVAYSMTSNGGHTGNLYENLKHAQERKAFMDQEWPDRVREIVPLFAIKDTK
jgi:hypothetical protein